MSRPEECLAPNPDVSGVGIRIAFYINTLLIAAVPRTDAFSKLLEPLQTNNGLNGLALLVTAVAQSASADSGSLSLYHAIIVLHMLTFLGIATSSVGEYNATLARFRILAVTSWCSMVAFFYLTLRVWITADTFGSQPECNDWTVYVLWGASVPATAPWLRWLIVTLVCLAILKFIATTTRTVASLGLSATNNRSNRSFNSDSTGGPGFLDRLLPCSYRPSRSPGLIARVFASIYSVVMLELTIRRNASSDEENVWSFGQIIALLITLMTVNEIIHFIFGESLGLNLGQRFDSFLHRIRYGKEKSAEMDDDAAGPDGDGNAPVPNGHSSGIPLGQV